MTLPSELGLVVAVAELVRGEAELWAVAHGRDKTLGTCCSQAAFAFMRTARAAGLEAEVVVGYHISLGDPEAGHLWNYVRLPQGRRRWDPDRSILVDLTATQFEMQPKPARVVMLFHGDPARYQYEVDHFGEEAAVGFLWDNDKVGIEELSARCLVALRAAGLEGERVERSW